MKEVKNNLLVELHIPDFQVAKDFYSQLGFVVVMEDLPTEKDKGYMTMKRFDGLGDTLVAFYGGDERVYGHSFFKRFPPKTQRGYAVEITVPVKNITDFYMKILETSKEFIVQELKVVEDHKMTWKDFRMVDPFGFYLRFTDLLNWGQ